MLKEDQVQPANLGQEEAKSENMPENTEAILVQAKAVVPHPQISNAQPQSDHEVGASKLSVRLAENELHIMQAVFLSELLHEESFFAHIPFSREKSKNMMVRSLEKPVSHGLLMAHYGEEPTNSCAALALSC